MIQAFSVSQLNTFLQCPYAWYAIYILKIKTPKPHNLFYGSAIHYGLEMFNKRKDPLEAIEWYIKTDPHHERPDSFDIEKNIQFGKSLMQLYQKSGPYFEPLMIEERKIVELVNPKTMESLPIPFTFRIDLLTKQHQIIDYKTTKGNGKKQDELNRHQGIGYFLAHRAMFDGQPPKEFIQVSLIKQKKPRIVSLPLFYSVDEEIWFWNLARKVLDMIDRKEYMTARPMVKSYYPCPVKEICPIHKRI
jgi:hypothetical protein